MMPLLFSSLFSGGAGAAPPDPAKTPVSFVDGVALPNMTANGVQSLTLNTHQPGDMIVAVTANRELNAPPALLDGYTEAVSGVSLGTSASGWRGFRVQTKVATSASETINWTGAYGFLIALRGARNVGRVCRTLWAAAPTSNWAVPQLYDLDTSGVGFLLSGLLGGEGVTSVTAPYQLLPPPSTARRFAGFLAENAFERSVHARFGASGTWNATFWSVEFLPFPPAEVVLPPGAWRLDPLKTQAGYMAWRGGMTVVNSVGGIDYQGFVPTEKSFSVGKRYWEVECAGEYGANANYNGYMGVASAEQVAQSGAGNAIQFGSIGWRGNGDIWSSDSAATGSRKLISRPTFGKGAVLMFAFDPATRGLWIGKDGVWANHPDTDAPTYASSAGSVWHPFVQGRDPNEGGTLRSLPSQFSFPVPTSCIPLG
ncbi:hypothetical protein E4L95_07065 [Paracoccus liaowanqingii]|uniref:B30.2/SPRY domain-containing protein n=1 Tax=Paracoccus liaowanqingii TaxID=2560053 RepID=A0A4Z1CAN7_9RHOB|nr:hypothetical protein [Paracoccus liaowanqingii]TGN62337.1 hypothetical protein E4L95_07065 [Paracoccus liaowanqingii]